MYALPDDFDPRALVGRELERVCFVPYAVELFFDAETSIRVFAAVVHEGLTGGRRWVNRPRAPISESSVMGLIGEKVVAAEVKGRADLVLRFHEGSQALRILEDDEPYESYHLRMGDQEIVV